MIDGQGEYRIVNPQCLYRGKGYSQWITDWFNSFISADADKHNSGPVAFLRSQGLPNSTTGAYISDVPQQVGNASEILDSTDIHTEEYRARYVNDPIIRIGSDRLHIFEDQTVFFPVVKAYAIAVESYKDWGRMEDFTGLTIDYGDNPQLMTKYVSQLKKLRN